MPRTAKSFIRNWTYPYVRPRQTYQRGSSGDYTGEIRSPLGSCRSSRRDVSPYSSHRRRSKSEYRQASGTLSLSESDTDTDTTMPTQDWRAQRPRAPEKQREPLDNDEWPVEPPEVVGSPSDATHGRRRQRTFTRGPLVEDEQLTPRQSLEELNSRFQRHSLHSSHCESSKVVSLEAADPSERRQSDLLAVKNETGPSRAPSRSAPGFLLTSTRC